MEGLSRPLSPAEDQPDFQPSSVSSFSFVDRDLDVSQGTVRLRYALDSIDFEEVITLPELDPQGTASTAGVDGALDLLLLAAGVSYFKAADPPQIDAGSLDLTPALARLGELLYGEGLAEFRFSNGRPVSALPPFSATAAAGPAGEAELSQGALVPIGGGKDSIVAVESLKAAGHDITLFSVGNAPPIERTARLAGLPHLVATRRLDPALFELNKSGALNGHVPVTAIVSSIAVLSAVLGGYSAVVMSNERSASEPNLVVDGVPVNHQFSKSFECELAIRDAIAERVAANLEYFSILRPLSELAIAGRFAELSAYHSAFTSCNTVFRIDAERRNANWCTDCPKCRFVFLMLAPFLSLEEMTGIFGRNLLDDPNQFDGFAELVGWPTAKPFECVGTLSESAAAMRMLTDDDTWRSCSVVARLKESVLPELLVGPAESVDSASPAEHRIPAAYLDALDAAGRS